MAKTQLSTETLTWLEANPELLEKLDHMRTMEADDSDMDVVRIELDMLELVKSIGSESFGRCVQSKEAQAIDQQKSKAASRIHGKKTKFP